ncbi:MAG: pyridoxal phosphate-dependent aminotransferase family protein [Verrucomicrobiota bacterium]|jgi:7-keto-8-aminopelargonate synthetase-like enzyme
MTEPQPLQFDGLNTVRLGRRRLGYFSGCDYFRLARDPQVARAAIRALDQHGLNVAASRRTTGNHAIYGRLEAELAKFFGVEAALLLPDGYYAPLAAAQALAPETDHVFIDQLAHGALRDAARMFRVTPKEFRHRDPADLARHLARCQPGSHPVVLTDGMFAHDGTVAPLRQYLQVLPSRGRLLVDDAHGVGVLGATGKGSLEHAGVSRQRIVQCGTLSKAFGVYGGFVVGSAALRRKIMDGSRLFAGTTPLPPPLAGAAVAALRILRRDPARRDRLWKNVHYLRQALRALGWPVEETPGPIVRLPALGKMAASRLKTQFLAAGIYPPFLKYGANSLGFFRIVISSGHTRRELDQVTSVLAKPGETSTGHPP